MPSSATECNCILSGQAVPMWRSGSNSPLLLCYVAAFAHPYPYIILNTHKWVSESTWKCYRWLQTLGFCLVIMIHQSQIFVYLNDLEEEDGLPLRMRWNFSLWALCGRKRSAFSISSLKGTSMCFLIPYQILLDTIVWDDLHLGYLQFCKLVDAEISNGPCRLCRCGWHVLPSLGIELQT